MFDPSPHAERLVEKLDSRNATIGIIGLGYVGLPLALTYAEAGFKVIGLDIDPTKSEKINSGVSYFKHISSKRIFAVTADQKLLTATYDYAVAAECDALIICVPTPLGKHNEPDLSYINATMQQLTQYVHKGQIISLESTTYPGTTEEVLKPWLENIGLSVGKDVFLIFSPEREDPGNEYYNTSNIPKVLGGVTEACGRVGESLYKNIIVEVVRVSNAKAAEMTKLLENIHRSVNIGLVNEMKIIAHAMDVNIHEVIRAASTKPFGFTPYFPGPGLGGHCIPIDPFYLTWKAKEYGLSTRFIELAGEVNSNMPEYVVSKIGQALNSQNKSIKGSTILVIGIAYKKNIDDTRESPAIRIIEKLWKLGASIKCYDPYFDCLPANRNWNKSQPVLVQELNQQLIRSSDACLICTDHDCIDYQYIYDHSNCIIDSRGRYEPNDGIYQA